jgi:hypothetical protein
MLECENGTKRIILQQMRGPQQNERGEMQLGFLLLGFLLLVEENSA